VNLNADGSGSDNLWDYWVTQAARHVNNPTWIASHAHVKYWEPQNEMFQNDVIGGKTTGPWGIRATWAQILRLSEDTRCIIKGAGTIHNYPSAGSSTSCSTYLAGLPSWSTHAAIDSGALITTPSQSPLINSANAITRNYLYCNNSPYKDVGGTSTTCTWSGGLNWGSQAADVIVFHFYGVTFQPEVYTGQITNIESFLSPADKAKPLWNGEGSWSGGAAGIWSDAYSRSAFVARHHAILWSGGVSQSFWYDADNAAPLQSGGTLTPAGIAWNTMRGWLVGSTPVNATFCSKVGTVYTCPLTEATGKAAELVWDSQYGPGGTTAPASCTTADVPLQCYNNAAGQHTTYTVPALYQADWIDLAGISHNGPVTSLSIGGGPVLFEGSVPLKGPLKLSGGVKLSGGASIMTH
jgi:hypothetical protein